MSLSRFFSSDTIVTAKPKNKLKALVRELSDPGHPGGFITGFPPYQVVKFPPSMRLLDFDNHDLPRNPSMRKPGSLRALKRLAQSFPEGFITRNDSCHPLVSSAEILEILESDEEFGGMGIFLQQCSSFDQLKRLATETALQSASRWSVTKEGDLDHMLYQATDKALNDFPQEALEYCLKDPIVKTIFIRKPPSQYEKMTIPEGADGIFMIPKDFFRRENFSKRIFSQLAFRWDVLEEEDDSSYFAFDLKLIPISILDGTEAVFVPTDDKKATAKLIALFADRQLDGLRGPLEVPDGEHPWYHHQKVKLECMHAALRTQAALA